MEQTFSLMALLRNDPDFSGALKKKTENVKRDKSNLLQASQNISKKYEREIAEGTKKQQLMLSEGKSKGLTEDEIFKGNQSFIPTVRTPILNLLFFMFREDMANTINDTTDKNKLEELTNFYIKQYGYEEFMKKLEEGTTYQKEVYSEELEDILSDDSNDPVEMDTYIYGNLTTNEFKKLKKLKALSQSPNEQEAFSAYRKCLELCKKWNLDFDKVPCNIKKG